MNGTLYELLAGVFSYPHADFQSAVARARDELRTACPDAAGPLQEFHDLLPWHDQDDPLKAMEEIYTRSFDVQAITTLDVGYVVFGDDYKRGELLVNLSREHKEVDNDCGDELGDHLPNLLRLIAVHTDTAMVNELVRLILAPALRQMVCEFTPERLEQKEQLYRKHHRTLIESTRDRRTMYGLALHSVYLVLQTDFDLPAVDAPTVGTVEFVDTVGQELEIEKDEGGPLGGCQSSEVTDLAKGTPGPC
ncbi:MAG: hypothetical protein GY838_14645 [bacterium]|nr:hypothetical protein [bacterium]